ncbi:TetR/AcrR family transcriptional regulator [Parasphingorhabdus pacifica]
MTSQRHSSSCQPSSRQHTSRQHTAPQHDPQPRGIGHGGSAGAELLRPATNRVDDAALLRAAHECVLDNGVRRSTLTEIARRAGVSRMTLYRRFPDVGSMVTALMTTEFSDILHRARSSAGTGIARQRLVTALVTSVRLLQEAPLFRRVLETDAELLLPYLVDRFGSAQLTAERFLRDYVLAGHEDGSIRRSDPAAQTRVLLVMAQSFVLSVKPASSGTDIGAVRAELASQLNAALLPTEAVAHPFQPTHGEML